jgi:hypothetical protein
MEKQLRQSKAIATTQLRQDNNVESDVRKPILKSNMGEDTPSHVRSLREEQLRAIGTEILEPLMELQRDLYEKNIQALEDEILGLKEDKKSTFQVWLRIRPALNLTPLSSTSFRCTEVTMDKILNRVHHVFGTESGEGSSSSRPVSTDQASIAEVWEKWEEQVRAAV